jgi:hypothetical protein
LQNGTDRFQSYVLFRHVLPDEQLDGVTNNGRVVDWSQEIGGLRIPLSLDPGQAAEVRIEHGKLAPIDLSFKENRGANQRMGVFVRRHISEFRDNYVDRNLFLSRMMWRAGRIVARGKSVS